ncbi:hypothetical protein ACLK1S_11610 [Escherichia coli]
MINGRPLAAGCTVGTGFFYWSGQVHYAITRLIFALSETGKAWKRKKIIADTLPEFDKSFRHPRYWGAVDRRSSDGGYRFNAAKVP